MKKAGILFLISLLMALPNLALAAIATQDSTAWTYEERSLFRKQLVQLEAKDLKNAVKQALQDGADVDEIITEASEMPYQFPLKLLQAIVIEIARVSKKWTSEEQDVFKKLLKWQNLEKTAKIALQRHGAPVHEIMIAYLDEGGEEPQDMLQAIYNNGGNVNNMEPKVCEILRRSHLIENKDFQVLMVYFASEGLMKNIRTCASKSGILACNMIKAAMASNYDPYTMLKDLLATHKKTRSSNEIANTLEDLFLCLKKDRIIGDIIGPDYLSDYRESGNLGGSTGGGIISPSRP